MRIVMMACTERGIRRMHRLAASLHLRFPDSRIVMEGRCAGVPGYEEGPRLSETTGKWFASADALVFFSAAGIAVRCIAPYVKDKCTDPAVLVIDEEGRFCISLLSGHMGGANRLCRVLAEETGALPVITTATDTLHRFAVDVFAKEHGLHIHSREAAKRISARIVAGETIKIFSDPVCAGLLHDPASSDRDPSGSADPRLACSGSADPHQPQKTGGACRIAKNADNTENAKKAKSAKNAENVKNTETAIHENTMIRAENIQFTRMRAEADVLITVAKKQGDKADALYLIPRAVTLGIGCRKGTTQERIREQMEKLLQETGVFREALAGIASIDLKKEEAGLHAFAKSWDLPLVFYSPEELAETPGAYSASAFVQRTTGVDNVCERSAVRLAMDRMAAAAAAAGSVSLLAGKHSGHGVTAALAVHQAL